MKLRLFVAILLMGLLIMAVGCGKKAEAPPEAPPPPIIKEEPVTPPEPPPPPPPKPELRLATIYFDYDKYNVRMDAQTILSENASSLTESAGAMIRIEGHCDERGTDEYNMALGQKRADSAKDYLAKYGVSPSRLSTISYGESRPADLGHNESAWAKNRRAEFKITSE